MNEYKYLAFGITNQCKNDFVLPFFDYDIIDLAKIERELHRIQNFFKLSNIYIIRSTNGFNAFSLDKLTFNTLKSIYSYTTFVDEQFIKYGLQRGFMTLRMGKDKIFSNMLYSKYDEYKKSLSHKKFFTEIMKFPLIEDINFDNEKEITLTMFPSNKHGFDKVTLENGLNL